MSSSSLARDPIQGRLDLLESESAGRVSSVLGGACENARGAAAAHPVSYDDRFKAWLLTPLGHYIHAECRRRALALYRRGRRHYSIRRIWEGVRLDWDESGRDADGFKCNDHYHSRMARKLMDEEPELAGFFETRSLKT